MHLLKAIEPALKDANSPQANDFVKHFFTQLYGPLRSKLADPYNIALKKGFCSLVQELASNFTKMPQLLGETIVAALSTSESIRLLNESGSSLDIDLDKTTSQLESLYVKTIMELSLYCHQYFKLEQFVAMKEHLDQNRSTMSESNLSLFVESAVLVCIQQPDKQQSC